MKYTNTGEMFAVFVDDPNREEGYRMVDLGNLFQDENGKRVLITNKDLAERYAHLVEIPVYVFKDPKRLL